MKSTGRFTRELLTLRSRSYDRCQSCGNLLHQGIPAYAGYADDQSPRYVGECCLPELSELATHVYWWWEVDKRVDPATKLWRYMDLAKFLHMLETNSLFFSRADRLGDPFEGASGRADRQPEWDNFNISYFQKLIRNPPEGYVSLPESEVEEKAKQLLGDYKEQIQRDRKRTFVSCWHANTGESEALWRLYCPPGAAGVAIETTAGLLTDALDAADVEIGQVQYIDFAKSFTGTHDRIFWKRNSLRHEAEVRAVIRHRFGDERESIEKPVDIGKLVVSLVASPFAPGWIGGLIESVVRRYGTGIEVIKSELLAEPFF